MWEPFGPHHVAYPAAVEPRALYATHCRGQSFCSARLDDVRPIPKTKGLTLLFTKYGLVDVTVDVRTHNESKR